MMAFNMTLTPAQQDLVERTHRFAEEVIRPVADHYDREEEFPWPVLEAAAEEGFYNPLFYRDLIGDPTGLSLPLFMEELFWGCAGIGLAIVMPALALSAMAQAATAEQLLALGAGVLRRAGRAQARGAVRVRARGRQRRAQPAHPRPPRGRRVGDRRPQDLDRQRRHRRRPRRQRDRRPRARPPRPGAVRRPRRHARAAHGAQAREARLPRLPHRRAEVLTAAACPAENLLGGDAKLERRMQKARDGVSGRSSTLGAFEQTRPMVAAQALGIGRAALEYACEYANQREAFGEPIIAKQGISFPLADLAADLDAARLLTWRAVVDRRAGARRTTTPRARCPSSRRPRPRCGSPSRRSRSAAARATCATRRSRSGTATRSSTRSSRARARSSAW